MYGLKSFEKKKNRVRIFEIVREHARQFSRTGKKKYVFFILRVRFIREGYDA